MKYNALPMPIEVNLDEMLAQHLRLLESLQTPSGLFRAAPSQVSTGYDKAWLRDNFYECLPFVLLKRWDVVERTYSALLEIFRKHEGKLDQAIANKPQARHEYIHARYHPETFGEFWEEWGNKQNDAVGAILFMLGELHHVHGRPVFAKADNLRVAQKLVDYLGTLQYWQDPDSGVWEEDEEIHASSVGACLAGLRSIARVDGIKVPAELIQRGELTLQQMLPRESARKYVDLALLSLIYPFNVVTPAQSAEILQNVEYYLLRERGVIRYKNDHYYNANADGYSQEAEWCFGLSWLALIYAQQGDQDKSRLFLQRSLRTLNRQGEVPELYLSNSAKHNDNSPLGWAEAMFCLSIAQSQQGTRKGRR